MTQNFEAEHINICERKYGDPLFFQVDSWHDLCMRISLTSELLNRVETLKSFSPKNALLSLNLNESCQFSYLFSSLSMKGGPTSAPHNTWTIGIATDNIWMVQWSNIRVRALSIKRKLLLDLYLATAVYRDNTLCSMSSFIESLQNCDDQNASFSSYRKHSSLLINAVLRASIVIHTEYALYRQTVFVPHISSSYGIDSKHAEVVASFSLSWYSSPALHFSITAINAASR